MTTNKDGTKTVISYRFNDDGKKVKVTRRIKTSVVREHVNPQVAERRAWSKFGLEKGHAAGPSFDTTSVGENIIFRPSVNWKAQAKEEEKGGEKGGMKDQLKDKKVKCRICSGEHFTARCPFKDTMAPVEETAAGGAEGGEDGAGAGAVGAGTGSYVPPHLRKGAGAGGEKMASKYEKDDLATLRVTNVSRFLHFIFGSLLVLFLSGRCSNLAFSSNLQVSELAEEQEIRDLFERFGRVTRVFLARDRETQRAKGFAFISFADRSDAARACEKVDGCTYHVPVFAGLARVLHTDLFVFSWLSPSYPSRRVCQEIYLDLLSLCYEALWICYFFFFHVADCLWLRVFLCILYGLINDDFSQISNVSFTGVEVIKAVFKMMIVVSFKMAFLVGVVEVARSQIYHSPSGQTLMTTARVMANLETMPMGLASIDVG